MSGGLEHLAHLRAVEMMLDIRVQFEKATRPGLRPVVALLAQARKQAEAAMVQLCIVQPHEADKIRVLQNEIIRFDDLLRFTQKIVAEGIEIDRTVTEQERADLADMIANTPGLDAEFGPTEVNDR